MSDMTPAQKEAVVLLAVGEHMNRHPDLPTVDLSDRGGSLQISTYARLGELADAPAVLAWAKTLTDPVVKIRPLRAPNDQNVTVRVIGTVNDVTVTVWDVDKGDMYRWCEQGEADRFGHTTIPLDWLGAYVAAGTVDGVS